MEYNEDPQTTIVREVKEETGLDVRIDRLLWMYLITTDPRGNSIDMVFAGTITGEHIRLVEHTAYNFFHPENLPPKIAYRHREAIGIWSKQA